MAMQAIFVSRAFTPRDEIAGAVILIDGSKIVAIGPRAQVAVPAGAVSREMPAVTAVPGFVDVHIHGAGGHDVMEATPEALDAVTKTVALRGTTSLVATTVTASEDRTCQAVSDISTWMRSQAAETSRASHTPQAEVLGIHFEGPFINPARRGVHPPEFIVPPSVELFRKFCDTANGAARILTLAPELPGALDLINAARKVGCVVSLGHTDATYAQAETAIERGATHAAHVFNAMRPFGHRDSGVIGAVLASGGVTAELIADGVHVDEGAMRMLLAAKGPSRMVLVSDGISATGMPDGKYRLGTFEVAVTNGVCRDADGKLAGSTLTLDRALRKMISLGVPLPEALRMLTENPARVLGLEKRKGILASGADADIVFLDENLEIAGVMTRGSSLLAR